MLTPAAPVTYDRIGLTAQLGAALTSGTSGNYGSAYTWLGDVPADWCGFEIEISTPSARDVQFDIAIGATGGGDAISANAARLDAQRRVTAFPLTTNTTAIQLIDCPVRIPGGTGLYARLAAYQSNAVINISVKGRRAVPGQHPGFAGIEPVQLGGAITSTSLAATLLTNATGAIDANDSWNQVVAACSRDYAGLYAVVMRAANVSGRTAQWGTLSSGISDGTGTWAIEDRTVFYQGSSAIFQPAILPRLFPVRAGSQLMAKAKMAANVTADKLALQLLGLIR